MGYPEDVLFEVELEDMCEEDPSHWEAFAEEEWKEFNKHPGETRDSVTGEVLVLAKVKQGCEEEMVCMAKMHVWDRVTREQAQMDPEGK